MRGKDRLICSNCGSENRAGRKFCAECAAPLAAACPSCGAANEPTAKFCGECASPLTPGATPTDVAASGQTAAAATDSSPVAERRLVSVLFADLVGFTTIAEGHDAEDTRELLNRYFELAREVIGRYGGTVEKFIGDAVMAVWGAPVAREADAELAVRAGLDLVDAVQTLGPGIQARAGVLTGEAAVTIGATNQGMVAGDLVNTASRLQSVAQPGTVLVGEATQRAASKAIAFEKAGEQHLKGKQAPVEAWRATRVVAETGGRNRKDTLEAPFVGRDEELRLLKDLYHATTREGRARLVSVIGPAGFGKTRLAWEFLKYVDGLADLLWWHEGRSPAYGDGISFWALGEMVRARCGLLETDDEATTRAKVAEKVNEIVADEQERRWIEPALLALLGVETGVAPEQLVGAWRTFFERLAATAPVVLVFEDFHNADSGLIDFVDHILEWSRAYPIYVVTLARPELLERRTDWGAGKRNFTSIYLEPLPEAAMRELLAGLVPGLPESAVKAIIARADGIPLYAVETIRMLLAEGKLALKDDVYVPVGDLTSLAVPETLTALIAARLDGLPPQDRALILDAAVLGQSFTPAALAAVTGKDEAAIEPRMQALVKRELLTVGSDPRSPERGQYAFVQALIREVAYGMLAKRDRKTRHLAAARFFESLGSDELSGALAGHYLAAHQNAPEGAEAEALAGQARIALRSAANRAVGLGANDQAMAFLQQALIVTIDADERIETLRRIALAAEAAADFETAAASLEEAVAWYRDHGSIEGIAAASAQLGRSLISWGRVEPAIAHLDLALQAGMASDGATAELWAQLGRAHMLHNEAELAASDADRALEAGARIDNVAVIADALITKAFAMIETLRYREGVALLRGAHALAVKRGLTRSELRAINNLAIGEYPDAPLDSISLVHGGIELARRIGDRGWLVQLGRVFADLSLGAGNWDDGLDLIADLEQGVVPDEIAIHFAGYHALVAAMRGESAEADTRIASVESMVSRITNPFQRGFHLYARSFVALGQGRLDLAFEIALNAAGESRELMQRAARLAGFIAVCRHDLGGLQRATELFDEMGPLGAEGAAARKTLAAGLAAFQGRPEEAARIYREALGTWRELRLVWDESLCELSITILLDPSDPEVRLAEDAARENLTRLGAIPLLERLDQAMSRGSLEPY